MIEIEILNWDTLNKKRADVKNPSWLRLELCFPQSQSLFGLTAAERYVFLSLLCLAGQKQTGVLKLDPAWFCHWAGGCFSVEEFLSAIVRLSTGHDPAIHVAEPLAERPRNVSVTCAGVTDGRTDERTDEDDERRENENDTTLRGEGTSPPSPDEILVQDHKDFLTDVPFTAIRAWLEAYGEPLIRDQLPKIRAAWESDEVRKRAGGKPLFVRHWLQNEEKQRAKNPPPPVPTAPPGTDNAAFDRLKLEVAAVDANPPDPDRVRKLIRSVTGGG